MIYAVTEIAVFMIGATVVGFLLGRLTKRTAPKIVAGEETAELTAAQATIKDLEADRAALKKQLFNEKERTRQLAAETTVAEHSVDFAEERRRLQQAVDDAEAQADRLRATIAERDSRIAAMSSGDAVAHSEPPVDVGYSSSAGTLADTRIVFNNDEEDA